MGSNAAGVIATKPIASAGEIQLSLPLIPPSVNHYIKHTRAGRHYVTAEAKAFKQAIAIFCRGQQIRAKRYQLDVKIYLGKGQRGDGDNFFKCVADGLVECGAIHSDAAISAWHLEKFRDSEHPRTEIKVSAL